MREQQRALAEVVEQQRREHEREPGEPDRPAAEVAHVGVERLAAGDHEHDRAEDQEPVRPVARGRSAPRSHGLTAREHRRAARDPGEPERGDADEPEQHDGAEDRADAAVPRRWKKKSARRMTNAIGTTMWLERRRGDLEALDGAEHRDGGRDDAVAIEQRRAEEPERRPAAAPSRAGAPLGRARARAGRGCRPRRGCRPA